MRGCGVAAAGRTREGSCGAAPGHGADARRAGPGAQQDGGAKCLSLYEHRMAGRGSARRGRGIRTRPRAAWAPRGRAVECRRPAKDGAQGQSGVRRGGLRWGATTVKLLGATWETGDNEVADAVTNKVTARRETGQHCTAKPWNGREAGGKTQGAVTEVGPASSTSGGGARVKVPPTPTHSHPLPLGTPPASNPCPQCPASGLGRGIECPR